MKLIKVTGSMTVESFSVDTAENWVRMNDATGDAALTFEEIGEAPAWEYRRVTPAESEAIDALLVVYRAAEAWRDGWGTDWTKALTPEGRRTESKILALINAVDAYRAEGPGGER